MGIHGPAQVEQQVTSDAPDNALEKEHRYVVDDDDAEEHTHDDDKDDAGAVTCRQRIVDRPAYDERHHELRGNKEENGDHCEGNPRPGMVPGVPGNAQSPSDRRRGRRVPRRATPGRRPRQDQVCGSRSRLSAPATGLQVPERAIASIERQQLLVTPTLDDPSFLQENDLIGVEQRTQTVCDDDDGPLSGQVMQGMVDALFGCRIHCGR